MKKSILTKRINPVRLDKIEPSLMNICSLYLLLNFIYLKRKVTFWSLQHGIFPKKDTNFIYFFYFNRSLKDL